MVKKANPLPSDKQKELYGFLIKYIEEYGYQPTQSEMAEFFKVTKNAIRARLKELEDRKLISMGDGSRERAVKIPHVKFKAYWDATKKD